MNFLGYVLLKIKINDENDVDKLRKTFEVCRFTIATREKQFDGLVDKIEKLERQLVGLFL